MTGCFTPRLLRAVLCTGRKSTTVQVAAGCKTRAVEVTITCYERVPISKARVRDEDTAASQQCNTVSDKVRCCAGDMLLSPQHYNIYNIPAA